MIDSTTIKHTDMRVFLYVMVAVILALVCYHGLAQRSDAAQIKLLKSREVNHHKTKVGGHTYLSVSYGTDDRLMPTCLMHSRQCERCFDNANNL